MQEQLMGLSAREVEERKAKRDAQPPPKPLQRQQGRFLRKTY